VLLGGPREARVQQTMDPEGIDRQTAERRVEANERADGACQPHLGVDPLDPDLFHLRIDSATVGLDTCVNLIVAASQSRMPHAHPVGQN
jgi:cytidylate kinase